MEAKTKEYVIWDSDLLTDEEAMNEWWADSCLDEEEHTNNPDVDAWYDYVYMCKEDEESNLNKEVDGIILCFGDCGAWDGRYHSLSVVGSNVAQILTPKSDLDGNSKFYADDKDVLGRFAHHDGVNHYVFRIAKDEEAVENLQEKICKGELTKEYFEENTKSLRPYVAEVYGWD